MPARKAASGAAVRRSGSRSRTTEHPKPVGKKKKVTKVSEPESTPSVEPSRKLPPPPPESPRVPSENVKLYVRINKGRVHEDGDDYSKLGCSVDGQHIVVPETEEEAPMKITADKTFDTDMETSIVHRDIIDAMLPSIRKGIDSNLLLVDMSPRIEHTASLLTRLTLATYQFLAEKSESFSLVVSMWEIGEGNVVKDLLHTSSGAANPQATIRWSPEQGPAVVGLVSKEVTTAAECAHAIASASIRSSKIETNQTFFKLRISRTTKSSGRSLIHTSSVIVSDLGSPFQEDITSLESPRSSGINCVPSSLSSTLLTYGKLVAGLSGNLTCLQRRPSAITFKFSAKDIATISRENPSTHILGDSLSGSCSTHIMISLTPRAAEAGQCGLLLRTFEGVRRINNKLLGCTHSTEYHLSEQKIELIKLSKADTVSKLDTVGGRDVLDKDLRELQQRQEIIDAMEKNVAQAIELKQLVEYEKIQKERTIVEMKRVEDNAKQLIVQARRGQQLMVDQYARIEIDNKKLAASKIELECQIEKVSLESGKKDAEIARLQQDIDASSREQELQSHKSQVAEKTIIGERNSLLTENARLTAECSLAKEEATKSSDIAESSQAELRRLQLETRLLRSDSDMNKSEYSQEVQHLKQSVKMLETERNTTAKRHADQLKEATHRALCLGEELERNAVDFRRIEVEMRKQITTLECELSEKTTVGETTDVEHTHEVDDLNEKVKLLELRFKDSEKTINELKTAAVAYKAEVTSQWSVEQEALISSITEGAELVSSFVGSVPQLQGSLDTLTAWMHDLDVGRYLTILLSHGIKDLKGVTSLTEETLTAMQITGQPRRKILDAIPTISVNDETSPAADLYSWMDSLHFRLTGQPSPSTPIQEYVARPVAVKRPGPAFHQIRTAKGLWKSPQRKQQVRKYAAKNEIGGNIANMQIA